jgi:hypothetical protein
MSLNLMKHCPAEKAIAPIQQSERRREAEGEGEGEGCKVEREGGRETQRERNTEREHTLTPTDW